MYKINNEGDRLMVRSRENINMATDEDWKENFPQ